MNKLLINLLVFVIVVLLVIYGFLHIFSNGSFPGRVINFNPDKNLVIHTTEPMYYYCDNKLYFSPTGSVNLDKPIWKGEIPENFYNGNVSVSPNSKYLVINNKKGLDVIDSVGNEICHIGDVIESSFFEHRPEYYWGSDFQWSSNSENIYLIKDDISTLSSLIRLNLKTKKIENIYHFEESHTNYYFGSNERFLYYTIYDKKGEIFGMKKVDLQLKKIVDTVYRSDSLKLITKDTILANINPEMASRIRTNKVCEIIIDSDSSANVYLIDGKSNKLIFKQKYWRNAFKNGKGGIMEPNSDVYLPKDYFTSRAYLTDDPGTIFIDLKTLKYNYFDKEIKVYFATKIENNFNLEYVGELRVIGNVSSSY